MEKRLRSADWLFLTCNPPLRGEGDLSNKSFLYPTMRHKEGELNWHNYLGYSPLVGTTSSAPSKK